MMREVVDEYGGVTVGEVAYGLPPKKLVSYYGSGDLLHLPFNFGLITLPLQAAKLQEFVEEYDAALPDHRRQDPWTNPLNGGGRDSARTPMQWGADTNAGFSETEPWLPVGQNHESLNVEAQKDGPRSPLSFNRALLQLRSESHALSAGGYRPLENVPDDRFVYLREGPDGAYLVALNFGDEGMSLDLPGEPKGHVVVSTFMDRESREEGALVLRPSEGCVVELDEWHDTENEDY